MKLITTSIFSICSIIFLLFYTNVVTAADVFKGLEIYNTNCQVCHGPDGRGVMPDTPDFTRGVGLMSPDLALLEIIRTGRGSGGIHPAYRRILSEKDMLNVITHLRTYLK
jgi:mono/diheme cytochrome c family protein